MEGVTNYIQIDTNDKVWMSPEGDFFHSWADCLRSIHKLTPKETNVLGTFLKERYRLSKKISDSNIVDRNLLNSETRDYVCRENDITKKHLNVILNKFRHNGVLTNNKFNLNLIPTTDKKGARLLINFVFSDEPHSFKQSHK